MTRNSPFIRTLNNLPKPTQYILVGVLSLVFVLLTVLVIAQYIPGSSPSNVPPNSPTSPSQTTTKTPRATMTMYASLGNFMNELTKEKGTFNTSMGKEFTVGVYLSGTESNAVDLVVKYDPAYLSKISQKEGELFPETIVNTSTKDEIKYSASTDPSAPKEHADGYLVLLTFRPLQKGTTMLQLDLQKNIVAQKGTNVLDSAEPLTVNVE
ncbi:MAG: cohesin domain-containing protein [bacterium]|nr:cohesin domain-containing protein [bacterium]